MAIERERQLVQSSGRWSRRSGGVTVSIVVAMLCAGLAVVGIDVARSQTRSHPSANAGDSSSTNGRAPSYSSASLAAAVQFDPTPNATGAAPDGQIHVDSHLGHLTSVRVMSANGALVGGAISESGATWLSNTPLDSGMKYSIAADVAYGDTTATATSTFQTLVPPVTVGATIFPTSGMVVGVAQPIVVRFDHDITSSAAKERVVSHFQISESPQVAGGWHWFSDHELHFRPESYWPVGETVTIGSDLDGWDAGNGMWGSGTQLVRFKVGDSHIALANLATDKMTVTDNGRVIAVYPISGGRPKYPTMNGTHIVLDRESVVHMVSSTNGIPVNSPDGYDELVYADVHISDSGEYVHAAPWSVGSQGRTNVSHGCINLSSADAYAFLGFSRVGDVVEVVGSPRPPANGDHGVMDWTTPWNQWSQSVWPPRPHPTRPTTSTLPMMSMRPR
jgi:lipoprotein-anchoring transpeptidase ErfK/SrfK